MSAIEKRRWTVAEYLAFENASQERHEFIGGEIYAMSGGTPKHAKLAFYTGTALDKQISERDCSVTVNDLRVLVNKSRGDYTYPDVSVVCGQEIYDTTDPNALVNPTLIIEVLSPSTEQYDRGLKFLLHQTVSTLQEYLLISQDFPRVERYTRQPENTWLYARHDGLDAILTLASIGCTLALADVYRKLPFDDVEQS